MNFLPLELSEFGCDHYESGLLGIIASGSSATNDPETETWNLEPETWDLKLASRIRISILALHWTVLAP
jgi:hypothetical protein